MLYMAELKHSPETCIAARDRSSSEMDAKQLRVLREIAAKHDATVVDGWSFPVGHQLWYVIDAPESHVVGDVFFESGAFRWNTITINPVMNHDSFIRNVLNPIVDGDDSEETANHKMTALS
ncbi:MAG TPA: hypothetical protein QF694_05375 [Dehalococcoidia bacterium]|jgi:hypothetical protein|nr:hypothetical protein [Chloroflexota bacterium]HJP28220.1 hypothetical protein [Dehalococcoidia bacterium]|tara:strand:- start:8927 stop:9289 length:363 start_codon:yes stop_codon:yes gene_type:complete